MHRHVIVIDRQEHSPGPCCFSQALYVPYKQRSAPKALQHYISNATLCFGVIGYRSSTLCRKVIASFSYRSGLIDIVIASYSYLQPDRNRYPELHDRKSYCFLQLSLYGNKIIISSDNYARISALWGGLTSHSHLLARDMGYWGNIESFNMHLDT